MDCEKFESTLIDELYEELDELTSAAAKRHVSGCARCAARIGGLRATRRVAAALPLVDPPPDLEERILAAAQSVRNVVPLTQRMARAVSHAGGWAMRPQTAMAAVFLVMIGTSAMFLRGRHAKSPSSAAVTVTDQGVPAASVVPPAEPQPDELSAAANAHGAPVKLGANGGVALASPSTPALSDGPTQKDLVRAARKAAVEESAEGFGGGGAALGGGGNPLGLPQASPMQAAAEPAPRAADGPGGGQASASDSSGRDFNAAMAAYTAGRFDDATRLFDNLAPTNPDAELWAARSVRERRVCISVR